MITREEAITLCIILVTVIGCILAILIGFAFVMRLIASIPIEETKENEATKNHGTTE